MWPFSVNSKLCGVTRRCLIIGIASVLLPVIVIASLVGVYYPKAPEIRATTTEINSLKINGMESVSVDADVDLEIVNKNKNYPIAFDPVELDFYFPSSPESRVGTGVLEGGVIPGGETTTRKLHAVFDAPWSMLGASFLRNMNQGATTLLVKGHVLGFSTILKSDFRLSSELECILSYTWDDQKTHKDCHSTKKVSLARSK
ncbi:hypothetical protein NGA_0624100 [Nannochloropsis gaditana CCMP526]|uniref:Late embryogenesis abundant protein LEA-2 subgroup domain-containing protein n=1 Tax=Nannochloropsis gaditana TaxID=72520 RepID=W7TUN9_9STRA|nr:hypothetical protein NGA_0624100 [Nannochloropsis gaditana CCMP526]EKU20779.1 hypothetical protein NGA_0624100 [Nannochloropsis gaditana CCMP526]EWM24336.1 hypothetical protein Naga_100105g14 [Nannochloropsis gaditana]|eukprot:XP_005855587.1 hypothetical protein NGA_0624100 [Nannochloropsis gaditana CCMP526]